MSLPDIPQDACAAIYDAIIPTDYGTIDGEQARRIIAAGWPQLCAAAWRHAADVMDGDTHAPARYRLRRMADEVGA